MITLRTRPAMPPPSGSPASHVLADLARLMTDWRECSECGARVEQASHGPERLTCGERCKKRRQRRLGPVVVTDLPPALIEYDPVAFQREYGTRKRRTA